MNLAKVTCIDGTSVKINKDMIICIEIIGKGKDSYYQITLPDKVIKTSDDIDGLFSR